MPRRRKTPKDEGKAKADALKAPETSTTGNNDNTTPASSKSASCGTSSHPVSAGGETRVSTAGESKRENVAESNASEALQDKRGEKRMGEIHKERSDGGERGPGENKHEKVNEINASTAVQDKRADALKAPETSTTGNNDNTTPASSNSASCGTSSHPVPAAGETRVSTAGESKRENAAESNASEALQDKRGEKRMGEIHKERSDGGERGPGENKHEKVNEINASTAVQDKRAGKNMAEIIKEKSGGGDRGPSRKSGEEENVSLRPSQFESKQKQRDERSSFAGNKGFRQDLSGRNSSVSQSYEGKISSQGRQHGYENRWRGRGGDNEDDSTRIDALGRSLSSILRHRAPQLGLKVRSDGYVVVKDLLRLPTKTQAGLPLRDYSVDDLKEAVKRDDKQRFGLHEEAGQLLIRANQGHSINMVTSEELLKPILSAEEVPVCIHGTYKVHLASIKKEGLKCMRRNHIHFATGQFKEDGVLSGMRGDCEVLIYMNVSKYLKDGMKLYRSENGVILAEGLNGVVPPEYFADIQILGKKRNNNI